LLNEHQKSIYEEYVLDNLSLSEIAEERGISRQGVHDIIKRADKALYEYENKLQLIRKFMNINDKVNRINSISVAMCEGSDRERASEIISITNEILDEL
ncbi:MAG: sigma factor-like helix-turn-helix DNA-binding protein, partial [Butyrivibrio sp.]